MGKLTNKRSASAKRIKKTSPAKRPRKLLNARKHAGVIPGMAEWALEEVRKQRDEW